MAKTSLDSNAVLLRKVKELSPELKKRFTDTFSNAALVLKFFRFLENQSGEKFKTTEAVEHLYGIKASHAEYTLYENRFFKLRKKLLDYFTETPVEHAGAFTPHEAQLHEIKNLMLLGKHQEADVMMVPLYEKLWADNVFELLPETMELMIHQNQILKRWEQNDDLYNQYDKALELFVALAEAKKLARLIYEVNVTRGIKKTPPYFNKLQRISINYKTYPRFKLIYNYVSAVCKMAGGGLDFFPDVKTTSRFVSTVRKLNEAYPDIPAQKYIAGYREMQRYQFDNLLLMQHFNSGNYRQAAIIATDLFQRVADPNSPFKRMRGNVFYSTTAMVQITGEQYHEALTTAKAYLDYLLEVKQSERAIEAYAEIIHAHIWLLPNPSGYSDAFVNEKLEQNIRHRKPKDGIYYHYYQALWLKTKYLLATGKYTDAQSVFLKHKVSEGFMDKRLHDAVLRCIALLSQTQVPTKELQNELGLLKSLRLKSHLPPDHQSYYFLEKILLTKLKHHRG